LRQSKNLPKQDYGEAEGVPGNPGIGPAGGKEGIL
jgi:hypothetical protein